MKRITLAILLLLITIPAWGASGIFKGIIGSAAASCGVGTELLCENFDGTTSCGSGKTSNCTKTWTLVGTDIATFNYATSPAPLEGTYSAYLLNTATAVNGWNTVITVSSGTTYFFFIWNPKVLKNSDEIFRLTHLGGVLMSVKNVSPEQAVYCGSVMSYKSSSSFTEGTTYYVWGAYTPGTGANAVCDLYISTTSTKPAVTIHATNGNATSYPDAVQIMSSVNAAGNVIDKLRVSTTDIGSNPQ